MSVSGLRAAFSDVRIAVTLRARDNRGEGQKIQLVGMELLALAVLVESPVVVVGVVMAMSRSTNRAVKHFALLGAERLIECFERRLRRLYSLSTRGCNSTEMCLSLHDVGVHAGPEWALPAQGALLVCSRDHRIAPFIPERVLIRRQLKPGLKIGETPNKAGIPLCATSLMPVRPLWLCLGLSLRRRN